MYKRQIPQCCALSLRRRLARVQRTVDLKEVVGFSTAQESVEALERVAVNRQLLVGREEGKADVTVSVREMGEAQFASEMAQVDRLSSTGIMEGMRSDTREEKRLFRHLSDQGMRRMLQTETIAEELRQEEHGKPLGLWGSVRGMFSSAFQYLKNKLSGPLKRLLMYYLLRLCVKTYFCFDPAAGLVGNVVGSVTGDLNMLKGAFKAGDSWVQTLTSQGNLMEMTLKQVNYAFADMTGVDVKALLKVAAPDTDASLLERAGDGVSGLMHAGGATFNAAFDALSVGVASASTVASMSPDPYTQAAGVALKGVNFVAGAAKSNAVLGERIRGWVNYPIARFVQYMGVGGMAFLMQFVRLGAQLFGWVNNMLKKIGLRQGDIMFLAVTILTAAACNWRTELDKLRKFVKCMLQGLDDQYSMYIPTLLADRAALCMAGKYDEAKELTPLKTMGNMAGYGMSAVTGMASALNPFGGGGGGESHDGRDPPFHDSFLGDDNDVGVHDGLVGDAARAVGRAAASGVRAAAKGAQSVAGVLRDAMINAFRTGLRNPSRLAMDKQLTEVRKSTAFHQRLYDQNIWGVTAGAA